MTEKLIALLTALLLATTPTRSEELCAQDLIATLRESFKNLAQANNIDLQSKLYETPPEPTDDVDEYDFIIAGCGSSGSVLLNRLSRISEWKILALEAGGEPDFLTEIPVLAMLNQFTHHNWGYVTERQHHLAQGLENQRMHWPRGKGLGGSSLINYMVYTRGNRIDYDMWAQLGNDGWSYEDVLPHFKSIEDANLARQDDGGYRNKGGDLSVEDVKFRTKSAELFVEAVQKLGYDYVDVNGRHQTGVEFVQANTRDGFRFSAEKAFVRPIRGRKNLTLRLNSHVTRVLVDEVNKAAYGITYVYKGKTYTARAKKEVILSSGTIGSPHVLMLSGIGPSKNLEANGIRVVRDLPVGQKLYDHPTYPGLTFTFNESIAYDFREATDPKSFLQLYKEGTGPMQVPGTAEALAFIRTNASASRPDVELVLLSTHFPTDKGAIAKRSIRMTDRVYDEVYKPLEDKPALGICAVLQHPRSFGRMEIQSADPFIYPKLYANYLSDPEGHDLKTLVAAIRAAVRVGESPEMRKFGSELVRTKLPGCEVETFDSDAYWECAAKHLTTTLYHQTTTCKMGPVGDDEAVVDHRLRVHGVKNLRVADASVIPIPLTGHTNAAAYMIGEKAAAMIIEDWALWF